MMPAPSIASVSLVTLQPCRLTAVLAWYFVAIWGCGFIATKTALQYVAPFTLLSIRFALGIVCLIPFVLLTLMRHGEVSRVTSLIYLTPVFAIAPEYFLFDVVPSALSVFGVIITCAGVALAVRRTPDNSTKTNT